MSKVLLSVAPCEAWHMRDGVKPKHKLLHLEIDWTAYEKNANKIYKGMEDGKYAEECRLCATPINRKDWGRGTFVHICNAGETICHKEDNDTVTEFDDGDMGCWAIGSSCITKLKKLCKEHGLNGNDYIIKS